MSAARHLDRGPAVFADLAKRLRELVAEEHHNRLSGVERFRVVNAGSPLRLEQVDGTGGLVLEEGEADFTIGGWFQQYRVQYGLQAGDLVWVARNDQEWHAVDVVGGALIKTWEFSDVID